MRTLVLWDIDYTLIEVRGLSAEVYAEAFAQVVGHPPETVAAMAGRTDRAIIAATLEAHGHPPEPEMIDAFAAVLGEAYRARQAEIATRGVVLPGARQVLETLAGRPDVVQSVLTGNMEPIAVCKLTALNLVDLAG